MSVCDILHYCLNMPKTRRKRKYVMRRQQYRRVAEAVKDTFFNTIQHNSNVISHKQSFNLCDNSDGIYDTENTLFANEISNDETTSNIVNFNVNNACLNTECSTIYNSNTAESSTSHNNLVNENTTNIYFNNLDLQSNYSHEYNISSISSDNSSSIILQDDDENCILQELRTWALKYNVSRSSLNNLLRILAQYHPSLPIDGRVLLKTPRATPNIIKLDTGDFYYFGLEYALIHCLTSQSINLKVGETLKISFNVDGIPLFKSSKLQLWPILGMIKNITGIPPFTISVFCGTAKPKPLDQFLNEFIVELNALLTHGFTFKEHMYFIEIHSFICDAPARAFLKCTKQHTGYSSCDKCTEPGEYYKHKIVFPNFTAAKRTNNSFRRNIDDDHHIGTTPLLSLPIDLVTYFPIDYMHNICLGVVKKLIFIWLGGPLGVRISHRKVDIISKHLISLREFIPIEFNRKPRSLEEIHHWKATEFRFFLLYAGIVVLKDVVDTAVYENFLLLHFAVSVLLSNTHIKNITLLCVKQVLHTFINHCKDSLYGLEFIVYNVHLLSHICDDVEVYGNLNEFSAFPFENYLGQLKQFVKCPTNPLQQIYRRITEIHVALPKNRITENKYLRFPCKLEHNSGPLIFNSCSWDKQYMKLYFENFILTIKQYSKADCYCLIDDGTVVEIQNIVITNNAIFIIGKQFKEYSSFYEYPYQSSQLNIKTMKNLSNDITAWPISHICGKCIIFPTDCNSFISLPIIHSIDE